MPIAWNGVGSIRICVGRRPQTHPPEYPSRHVQWGDTIRILAASDISSPAFNDRVVTGVLLERMGRSLAVVGPDPDVAGEKDVHASATNIALDGVQVIVHL